MTTIILAALISSKPQATQLESVVQAVAQRTLTTYAAKGLKPDELGISVKQVMAGTNAVFSADYRGDESMYPASVVKLFFMAYAGQLIDSKKLELTKEFERGIREMIVESDNDATGYVLECVTGATSGPELPEKELKKWMSKRQAVNKWFKSLGYTKVNACQKPWSFGPFGRERQGYGPNYELRNSLTPNESARLMTEIIQGKCVSAERSRWMLDVLARPIIADGPFEGNSQSKLFVGKVLPKGTKLWSKAGWTDTVRHDVAGFKLPDGRTFVFAIFTKAHSNESGLIPYVAEELLKELGAN